MLERTRLADIDEAKGGDINVCHCPADGTRHGRSRPVQEKGTTMSNWNKDEVKDIFARISEYIYEPLNNDALAYDEEDDLWFVRGHDGRIYACMFYRDGHMEYSEMYYDLFSWAFEKRSEQVPADLLL